MSHCQRLKLDKDNPTKADRSKNERCPCCLGKLQRIGKGTRKKRNCINCNSTLAKELKCHVCHQNEIWRGSKGQFCNNCGNEHDS